MSKEMYDKGGSRYAGKCSDRITSSGSSRPRTTSTSRCRTCSPSTAGDRCGTARGLERKTRSLLNLVMLTALNRPHEFKSHVKAALKNGCTKEEIPRGIAAGRRSIAGRPRASRRSAWRAKCSAKRASAAEPRRRGRPGPQPLLLPPLSNM